MQDSSSLLVRMTSVLDYSEASKHNFCARNFSFKANEAQNNLCLFKLFGITMKNSALPIFLSISILLLVPSESYSTGKNTRTLSHYSRYLQKDQKMNVYVPESTGRHSVLYLLHGATGDYTNWLDRTDLKNIADKYNLIIVMPDGGTFSWYSDSQLIPESQYESYVVKELIPFIDSSFATYAEKNGRGVCGLSMGGFGAIKFGLKYPQLFSSASSLSGVLVVMRHPDKWSMVKVFGTLSDNASNWKREDLIEMAQSSKDTTVALKFDTGVDDVTLEDNRLFLSILQKLRRTFEYGEFPGGHTWRYWGSHIEEHLQFHSRHLLH